MNSKIELLAKDGRVVKDLSEYIRRALVREYDYCGVMDSGAVEGDGLILLNSGNGNIKVRITWEKGSEE